MIADVLYEEDMTSTEWDIFSNVMTIETSSDEDDGKGSEACKSKLSKREKRLQRRDRRRVDGTSNRKGWGSTPEEAALKKGRIDAQKRALELKKVLVTPPYQWHLHHRTEHSNKWKEAHTFPEPKETPEPEPYHYLISTLTLTGSINTKLIHE